MYINKEKKLVIVTVNLQFSTKVLKTLQISHFLLPRGHLHIGCSSILSSVWGTIPDALIVAFARRAPTAAVIERIQIA